MAEVQRERSIPGTKYRYYAGAILVDGGGNVFRAKVFNTGGYTEIRIDQIMPNWTLRRVYTRPTPSPTPGEIKCDYITMCQVGRDILWDAGFHTGDVDAFELADIVPGVCVPYPVGVAPFGMTANFAPDVDPTPIPEPCDCPDTQEIINGMHLAFGGNPPSIRQGLEDKAKDAIRELNMHSASIQERGVDQWLMDRVYQTFADNVPGFWTWLRLKVMGHAEAKKWEETQAAFEDAATEMEAIDDE